MKRRGYTLFEMVVVVALIVLLLGLSIPPIEAMYADYKLEAAADQVRGCWAAIRARAISEGRPYRFSYIPGSGSFRAAPDAGAFWSGDLSAASEGDNQPLMVQDSLVDGTLFEGGDAGPTSDAAPPSGGDSGSWATVAVFLPDGTAQQDAQIVLRKTGAGPIVLRLRGLTGGVSTRRATDSVR